MTYCLNPTCQKPQNPPSNKFCQNCGSKLLLREHYRALKPLGQGTFSKTYLAIDEDIPSKPRCVIKQFFPPVGHANADKAVESFRREALQLDKLGKHPQIPQLLAYFMQDQHLGAHLLPTLYMVQEFIEGKNLAEELPTSGAFSERQILQLLNELLPVLEFVHKNQGIHRDIKPMNLIRRTGSNFNQPAGSNLVLVGFGASKILPANAAMQGGTIIGSPEYTAPEQLEGQAVFASDLYSLGVTCLELLTQTDPFNLRDRTEWSWRQQLPRPVSAGLGCILDKMLANSLTARYASATEILADLRSLQPTEWKRLQTLTGHSDRVRCVAVSPDGQTIASGGEDNTIRLWGLGSSNVGLTLGNWLSGHTGWVNAIAFSPDGQQLVSGGADRAIKVWNLGTGKLIRSLGNVLSGHTGWVNAIAISADGQTLVTGSADQTIKLWQLTTGKLLATLTGHAAWIEAIALSPDRQILASGSGDKTIKLWNVQKGQLLTTLTGHTDVVRSLAFSPDTQLLASGSSDRTIKLWQVNTGELLADLPHSDWVNAIALTPNGQTLVAGTRDGTLTFWNPYTADLLNTLSAHSAAVNAVTFSPDGQMLLSGSADGSVKIWRVAT